MNKSLVLITFLLSFLTFSVNVFAADSATEMDWFPMIMWLAGGLALFLYGMEQLIKSLLVLAGDQMKKLLAKLTTNRVMGALTGAGVTAVIQSSSVTTVLTVGFVSAGLMSLTQAAGVIMGANLGTTITAQVIAFKITSFALLMLAVGFAIQFFAKLNKSIAVGRLIMGLGMIFFGMDVMSQGMSPLRDYQPFLDLMADLQNPFLGILAGFVFTALIQSSSATIGIIIVMASNGFLTLPAGIALAMGANIGTTVTALLSTIGKSREAIRAGLIHLQFNVLGVLIMLPFIPQLSEFAMYLSSQPIDGNDVTVALMAENTPREIANANTLFNLINIIILLPFIPAFLWVVYKVLPVTDVEKGTTEFKPEYLDETFISTPSLALEAVEREIEHYQVRQNLFYRRVVAQIEKPNIDKISREDFHLHRFRDYKRKILVYLGRIGQYELTPEQHEQFLNLMTVLNSMEAMLDSIEFNLLAVLHEMVEENISPSKTMQELVGELSDAVGKSIDIALKGVVSKDNDAALNVISLKSTIDLLIQDALKHQVSRFKPTEERLKVFRYEMQLVDGFKQLHTLSKRISRLQLVQSEEQESKPKNVDSEKVD